MCRPSKIEGQCEIRLLYLLKTLILYISCMRITPRVCTSVLSLTLGAQAHSEGYSSCRVCMCVCVCVCVCVQGCQTGAMALKIAPMNVFERQRP